MGEFKLRKRIIRVKSIEDYETSPDGDEMLIFQEPEEPVTEGQRTGYDESVDLEEIVADDVRLLHRLFIASRFRPL